MKNNIHTNKPPALKEFKTATVAALALIALIAWSATPVHAGNILLNTNFSLNTGQKVPTDWTYFDDPTILSSVHDYWIGGTNTGGFYAAPLSGTQYYKQWGTGYFHPPTNNVAGIYQEFASAPNDVYQASGWFYSSSKDGGGLGAGGYAWVDVSFLDSGGNVLALYTSGDFSATVGLDGWFQYSVTNACNLASPISTGDPYFTNYSVTGTVTQMVAPANTATVRYRFNLLQAGTGGGSCYLDDPDLEQLGGLEAPVIASVLPQNMIFYPPTNGFNFNVSSPSGSAINSSAIHLTLNGTDVSGSLVITGSAANKNVVYNGLQSNMTYTASMTATDVYNLSTSASTYFETTWVGILPILYSWEAEDFDFTNGMHIDFPDICNANGDNNCYYGKVGTVSVDESGSSASNPSHLYRAADNMNINTAGDFYRLNLFDADRPDYELNPFNYGEWANYTRNWANGTYWVVARVATDVNVAGQLTLSSVISGTPSQLGTFTISNGLGWTTFENVYLLDTNGNRASVKLNGVSTLRVTSLGNLLPNFFALVEAQADLPILSGMYPDGTHPLEYATNLTFTVSTSGATFPANGIKVNLDGFDVSSALVFSGPPSSETVNYPNLLANATHTAIITVTNSLGHGIAVTNQFDTFDPNNVMVEAADFDFGGGQYITFENWYPDAYYDIGATTNIDYQHTTLGCEEFPYRTSGISQQQGSDYLTPTFVDYGGIEFDLSCFGGGDWANYTRDYPPGHYFIYARTAGFGPYSMYLQQVVSGAGTVNQTVSKLGNWNSTGASDISYAWVPLTDDGLVAPVLVTLTGVETLRITTPTGDCYPNYFMLVPASGVRLSAASSGGHVVVSFSSKVGTVYRVFSRNSMGSGSWTLVTSVMGTGGVVPVTVPSTAAVQFYTVVAP